MPELGGAAASLAFGKSECASLRRSQLKSNMGFYAFPLDDAPAGLANTLGESLEDDEVAAWLLGG